MKMATSSSSCLYFGRLLRGLVQQLVRLLDIFLSLRSFKSTEHVKKGYNRKGTKNILDFLALDVHIRLTQGKRIDVCVRIKVC